jgi:uncharacterized membrane protein YqjE
MENHDPASAGFMGAFRALGDSLLATAHDRLELFSAELQEEKFRLVQTFMWISAAVFTAMMAITFVSLTLVYLFWGSARLFVLGGFALFYAAALLAICIAFRRYLARQPQPFADTLKEIREDRTCIQPTN